MKPNNWHFAPRYVRRNFRTSFKCKDFAVLIVQGCPTFDATWCSHFLWGGDMFSCLLPCPPCNMFVLMFSWAKLREECCKSGPRKTKQKELKYIEMVTTIFASGLGAVTNWKPTSEGPLEDNTLNLMSMRSCVNVWWHIGRAICMQRTARRSQCYMRKTSPTTTTQSPGVGCERVGELYLWGKPCAVEKIIRIKHLWIGLRAAELEENETKQTGESNSETIVHVWCIVFMHFTVLISCFSF